MKIDELLYFAPGVTFDKLDLRGGALPKQFERRMRGFYLEPAVKCAEAGYGFAAGILLMACIDALARFQFGGRVGSRFRQFAERELPSFAESHRSHQLYDAFRNGLIHEGRIKAGAQFTFDIDSTVEELQEILVVNPARLAGEVERALDKYVARLKQDERERERLANRLSSDHAVDV